MWQKLWNDTSVTGAWETLCRKTERRDYSGGPWLGFWTFTAGAAGSIPIQGTKIPYTMHLGGKKKERKKWEEKKRMGSEKQR